MSLREHVMETVAAVEITVPAGELLALLDERDALKDRVSMLEFRLGFGVSGPPKVETIECTCTDPPTVYEVTKMEWDMGGGESWTEVAVVEPPPLEDCSCKEPAAPVAPMYPKVADFSQDIERAVCGSRQPIGQVVESPVPVLVDKPFVSDKGAGKPSQTVVPWRASYTPNQCRLALQIFAEGHHGVTVASQARVTKQTAHDIGKAYATQIEHMAGMSDKEREHFLDSLYRQMLARWKAAGKDPAVQPELPLPNKTISEAAKPDKPGKGRAAHL